jgi:hypothetical protein
MRKPQEREKIDEEVAGRRKEGQGSCMQEERGMKKEG